MKILYAVINKPAQLIEVFSACKYLKLSKVVCYVPVYGSIVNTKPFKIKYQNYIQSINNKQVNFKVCLKKYQVGEDNKIINKLLKLKKIRYFATLGENSITRIKIFFNKNIKSIAITDGSQDSFSPFNYFIMRKSKFFLNYFKIPFFFVVYNFFKLDLAFSYFPSHKYFYSKITFKNFNYELNKKLKKTLLEKKIDTLILEDPTKTLNFNEILKKYKLSNKNYCSIGRNGIFRINTKIYNKISIIPEVLLGSGLIKVVYTYPQSSVYTYTKSKKIKTIKLPSKIFNHPNCAKIFQKYILKKFLELR